MSFAIAHHRMPIMVVSVEARLTSSMVGIKSQCPWRKIPVEYRIHDDRSPRTQPENIDYDPTKTVDIADSN